MLIAAVIVAGLVCVFAGVLGFCCCAVAGRADTQAEQK